LSSSTSFISSKISNQTIKFSQKDRNQNARRAVKQNDGKKYYLLVH
jgi:hypothetical protein